MSLSDFSHSQTVAPSSRDCSPSGVREQLISDRNYFLLVLRLLLVCALFVSVLLIDPYGWEGFRESKLAAMTYLAAIAGCLLVLFEVSRCRYITARPVGIPFLLFVFVCFFGLSSQHFLGWDLPWLGLKPSFDTPLSLHYSQANFYPFLAWFLIFLASAYSFNKGYHQRCLAMAVSIVVMIQVLVVIGETMTNLTGLPFNPVGWFMQLSTRGQTLKTTVFGTIGNPNYVAGYLAVAIWPVWSLSRVVSTRPMRWFSTILCPLALLSILVCRSKGGLLAFGCGASYWLAAHWWLHRSDAIKQYHKPARPGGLIHRWRWLGILVLIAIVVGGITIADQTKSGKDRGYLEHWLQTVRLRGDSVGVRALLAVCSQEMWLENPWTGNGPGAFKVQFLSTLRTLLDKPESDAYRARVARLHSLRAYHPHNEYLLVLVEYGIIGLLLVALWFSIPFLAGWRCMTEQYRNRDPNWVLAAGRSAGVVACLGNAWFDMPLHRPSQAVLVAVLLGAGLGVPHCQQKLFRFRRLMGIAIFAFLLLPVSFYCFQQSLNHFVANRLIFRAQAIKLGQISASDSQREFLLRRASALRPGEGYSRYLLAEYLLFTAQDYNGAIAQVRLAQPISDLPTLALIEARAQLAKDNLAPMSARLEFLKQVNPNYPGLNYLLGRMFEQKRQREKAVAAYLADLKHQSNNPDLWDSYLRLGRLLVSLEKFQQAEKIFLEFLNGRDTSRLYPYAEIDLARLYWRQLNRPELALEYYQQAIAKLLELNRQQDARQIRKELEGLKQGL